MPAPLPIAALVLLLAQPAPQNDLERAVTTLKQDAVPNNASEAIDRLRNAGPEVVPLLEQALNLADHTQRQLAASLLRHRTDAPTSAPLIAVSVEGLRHDDLPASMVDDEYLASFWAINAADSVEWLAAHADAAAGEVRAALASPDAQQAFLAAVVCGHGRIPGTRAAATRILVPHLADNAIRGDGVLAAVALQRMGPELLPDLRTWRDSGDAQHKAFIGQIIRELENPSDRTGNTRAAQALSDGPKSLGIGENALADTPLSGDTLRWNPPPARPAPKPPAPPKARE